MLPSSQNDYQLPSWPATQIDRELWNNVMGSIGARLRAREDLEPSFQSLIEQGTQASLDYIQISIAPQLEMLRSEIEAARDEIDEIIGSGTAPNSALLGNHPPSYYATAEQLSLKADGEGVILALAEKADAQDVAEALALKADAEAVSAGLATRVPYFAAGAELPAADIGPIWHAGYAAVMTWQIFSANGAAYAGYASVNVGQPIVDGQSSARVGFLKRNGASLSKTAYAALWHWALHHGNVVALGAWTAGPFKFADNGDGTFKLPYNSGEFERLWDDARGVDAGRAFGSWQDSGNRSHTHPLYDPGHVHGVRRNTGNGGSTVGATGSSDGNAGSNFNSALAYTGITIAADGGGEARGRNVALLGAIKF